LRPFDQEWLERLKTGIRPEQRAEELLGRLRRQGLQPQLTVVRLTRPTLLVLGPIVDDEKEPGRRQALDHAIEEGLRLRVDPLKILDDEQERLDLALS
jgi:hypothetical protein